MDQDEVIIPANGVDEHVRSYFSEMSDEQYEQLHGPDVQKEMEKIFRELLLKTEASQQPSRTSTAGTKRKGRDEEPQDRPEENLGESDMMVDEDLPTQIEASAKKEQEQRFNEMIETFEQIDLRSYQWEMVNIALQENTIVHLATGTGKTMIAMTLIHKMSAAFKEEPPKQTVFLVPSVVLAIQQSQTLTNNLPFSTAVAYGSKTSSQQSVESLKTCNIIVATHGTMMNLIQHHGFGFNRCNLLIVDECHNCVGTSLYNQVMESYTRNKTERPRVVGLTASPLLSVKKNHSDEQIEHMLDNLEAALDSKIVSVGQYNTSIDVNGDDIDYLVDTVKESEVLYGVYNHKLPSHDMPLVDGVHERRKKEFALHNEIMDTLGPLPLRLVVQSLLESMSIYVYERESEDEFANARRYLESCIHFCRAQQKRYPKGIASKLHVLSSLLQTEFSSHPSAVGVVFVERRLTAFALDLYFRYLQRNEENSSKPSQLAASGDAHLNSGFGQFMDADDAVDPSGDVAFSECEAPYEKSYVRSAYLVRSAYQQRMPKQETNGESGKTAAILQQFNARIINCLVCTSVAEEGLDIKSCSFAIAFDGVTSSKRYVQMKGRVRQKRGKFFLMNPLTATGKELKLSDLRDIAWRVDRAILRRSRQWSSSRSRTAPVSNVPNEQSIDGSSAELLAARNGVYRTTSGELSKHSAKSLLYRFYLCQTMDNTDRQFRETIKGKLPRFTTIFNRFFLILPGHIEPRLRRIPLPDEFSDESQRKRESTLSLMACVRLHKHGLLSDQLLPLTQKNIQERVSIMLDSHQVETPEQVITSVNNTRNYHVYKMTMDSTPELRQARELLKSPVTFAIFSRPAIDELPCYEHIHARFGKLVCSLHPLETITLSETEVNSLVDFFTTIMNARWSKRNGDTLLRPNSDQLLVGAICEDGSLNLPLMEKVVVEGNRVEKARRDAVLEASLSETAMPKPRMWTKLIQPSPVYIAFHREEFCCDATSSSEKEFVCTILWKAPRSMFRRGRSSGGQSPSDSVENKGESRSPPVVGTPNSCSEYTVKCRPSDCIELPFVSDPGLLLETILLPQMLYLFERQLVSQNFLQYCRTNFPVLAEALQGIGWREVRRLLTSVSSEMPETYERFEWLGDGVVKLLVTQLCNEKNEIASWIQNFHEGNLSELRSVIVSNKWLAKVCTNAHFDNFLFTKTLDQKSWTPRSLEHYDFRTGRSIDNNHSPAMKTCADFIEALLGSIFHSYGFEKARTIAIEIHAVPASESSSLQHFTVSTREDSPDMIDAEFFRRLEGAVGITPSSNLLLYKQAFCHASNLDEQMKSNEILEWIGDAVLTIAVRTWIFKHFDLSPGDMTLIEASIVSNGTLSFIATYHRLHHFIMHQEETLPQRINAYTLALSNINTSTLWTTNPPKAVADVVEALIGAVYLDKGLEHGTKAVYHCLEPVLRYFLNSNDNILGKLSHPKSKIKSLGGDLFTFKWTVVDDKTGVKLFVAGRPIGFVPGDSSASTQVQATAVVLRALQKNSFLTETLPVIRNLAGDL